MTLGELVQLIFGLSVSAGLKVGGAIWGALGLAFLAGTIVGPGVFGTSPQQASSPDVVTTTSNAATTPATKPEGPHHAVAEIIRIRQRNNVIAMSELQNQLALSRLPTGVFGFATAYSIESFARHRNEAELKLTVEDNFLRYEMHKTNGGPILLAYVSPSERNAILDPSGTRTEFDLFNLDQGGMSLVEVPLTRITDVVGFRDIANFKGVVMEVRMRKLKNATGKSGNDE